MLVSWIGLLLVAITTYVAVSMYRNSDMFQLKCVISSVDNNTYCVRDRENLHEAADLLARNTTKMRALVDHVGSKYPDEENIKRLVDGFDPKSIVETLPTSEHTAYSENKGEKIAFCVQKYKDQKKMIDPNTLFFVSVHELAHVATKSVGHTQEFWDNFKHLLTEAKEAGLYRPVDYNKNPAPYCGMTLTDSPLF